MKRSRLALVGLLVLLVVLGTTVWFIGQDRNDPNVVATLNRGLNHDPESLSPHGHRSSQAETVIRDISEGLVTIDRFGQPSGGVAESWEVSDDGLSYTFTLRKNAKWSNGEQVIAQDFVLSFRRLMTPSTAAPNATVLDPLVNATQIVAGELQPDSLGATAISDSVLRLDLVSPVPYLPQLLVAPATYPVYLRSGNSGIEQDVPGELTAITNGAYRLESRLSNAQITLGRNPHYWDKGSVEFDRVVYHIVPEELEVSRFRAGELDVTNTIAESQFGLMMESRPEEVRVAPQLGVYYYGFNFSHGRFASNVHLRRALSLAIDRDTLVEKIVGRGEQAAFRFVPPGTANYPTGDDTQDFLSQSEREEIARAELGKAGFDKDNVLEFELRINTDGGHEKIALAIQSMWRRVLGVEAEIVAEEFQVFLSNVQQGENTEVFRLSWTGDYNDANTFLQNFRGGSSSNYTGYNNQEVIELLDRASRETDLDERQKLLVRVEQIVMDELPVIPLYFYVSKHLVSLGVSGWSDNVLDIHPSQHLRPSSK